MNAVRTLVPTSFEVFAEAMARLVSGVAVVTAQRADGEPCGLLVSSICSYSASPPSILIAIGSERGSYPALVECVEFGVHLLGIDDGEIAKVFASRSADKFAGLRWHWNGLVPRLHAVPVSLICTRQAVLHHGDHAIIIGEVTNVEIDIGKPMVYYRRRFSWRLC